MVLSGAYPSAKAEQSDTILVCLKSRKVKEKKGSGGFNNLIHLFVIKHSQRKCQAPSLYQVWWKAVK